MTRLKMVRPLLAEAKPTLARAPENEAARSRARRETMPWRAWYNSADWLKLRRAVLKRDGWICQQTGVILQPGRTKPNSAVVDHIVPHRGDRALFFDPDNLQSVSKHWHDRVKQSRERRGEI